MDITAVRTRQGWASSSKTRVATTGVGELAIASAPNVAEVQSRLWRRMQHAEPVLVGFIALILGFWRLPLNGLGNLYYTAADITGSRSLRALFFATFDRGGIMAVDKPPLGLVGPALAIRLFGISSWTVLGPQVVLFAAGIVVFFCALRRWTNRRVAWIGAASLLLTPISVAVARSNNPDELLVFFTIISLVFVGESLRDARFRWVVAAGIAVGLAFTTKQLQALVGVPALVVTISVLSVGSWSRRVARTSVFGVCSVVTSAAWLWGVDRIAPSRRPYISNARNNSEFNLAFGFNGSHRVGKLVKPPSWVPVKGGWTTTSGKSIARLIPQRSLFANHYIAQTSWLLAVALVGAISLIVNRRTEHQRLIRVLFGWSMFHALVLAYTPGKFSPYYMAPLVPGIAGLIALSVDAFAPDQFVRPIVTLPRRHLVNPADLTQHHQRERAPLAKCGGLTMMLSVLCIGAVAARPYIGTANTVLTCTLGVLALTLHVIVICALARRRLVRVASLVVTLVALTGVPTRYVIADVTSRQSAITPNAEMARGASPSRVEAAIVANDSKILSYVQASSSPMVATSRMAVGAGAVVRGIGVVPLGGFFGTDPYPSLPTFTLMVATGKVRWVAVPDLPPGRSSQGLPPGIVARPWGRWVRANCRAVKPETYGGLDGRKFWSANNEKPYRTPLVLYDCSLRRLGTSPGTPRRLQGIFSNPRSLFTND